MPPTATAVFRADESAATHRPALLSDHVGRNHFAGNARPELGWLDAGTSYHAGTTFEPPPSLGFPAVASLRRGVLAAVLPQGAELPPGVMTGIDCDLAVRPAVPRGT